VCTNFYILVVCYNFGGLKNIKTIRAPQFYLYQIHVIFKIIKYICSKLAGTRLCPVPAREKAEPFDGNNKFG
jgi:hypothetical protein